jgi:hypothetical protein
MKPEFKPIGGDGDGVMERKEQARWSPLLVNPCQMSHCVFCINTFFWEPQMLVFDILTGKQQN